MNVAGGRYSSHSPPARIYEHDAMANPTTRASPRDGRAPLLSGHEDDADGSSKRRRIDAGAEAALLHSRPVDPYRAAAEAEYAAEEDYRRSRASGGGGPSPRNGSSMYAGHDEQHYSGSGPTSADRRSIGDESFDSNVPLARRRGDAAQAKASRLHIDTGYGEGHSGGLYDASRNRLPPYQPAAHGARSAPANKVSFSERELPSFDPRGEPPPRGYVQGDGASAQGTQLPPVYGRRDDGAAHESNARRREPLPGQGPSVLSGYRGGPGGTPAQPLTATRNVFMPQTATLPSPAYHTTQFVRQAGGSSGAPPSTNPGNSTAHGLPAQSAAANHAGGPRTAGLNPPMTARLPEHLRSPPSSKTQFLSLFSNFYDSLQDSRTLKATLEDQVRRSNTLLQTLQRSARVLELTVERRLVAERTLWESKVSALEERCRRLEQKTGAGSPTPVPEDHGEQQAGAGGEAARSSSNGNGHAEGTAEQVDAVDAENVEPENVRANSDEPAEKTTGESADADAEMTVHKKA